MGSRSTSRALIGALAFAALLGACTSPLELDTPRVATAIVPPMRLRSATITLSSGDSLGRVDSTVIGYWLYSVDTVYMSVTRANGVPHLSLGLLLRDSLRESAPIMLRSLNLFLTDVPIADSVELDASVSSRSRIVAQMIVDRDTFAVNPLSRRYTMLARLRYTESAGRRRVSGTIEVTIRQRPEHRMRLVVAIEGEQ